jgi:hypothetical protein
VLSLLVVVCVLFLFEDGDHRTAFYQCNRLSLLLPLFVRELVALLRVF